MLSCLRKPKRRVPQKPTHDTDTINASKMTDFQINIQSDRTKDILHKLDTALRNGANYIQVKTAGSANKTMISQTSLGSVKLQWSLHSWTIHIIKSFNWNNVSCTQSYMHLLTNFSGKRLYRSTLKCSLQSQRSGYRP